MLKWIVNFHVVKGYKPYPVLSSNMRFEKPGSPGSAASTHKSIKIQLNIVQLFVLLKRMLCVKLYTMLLMSTIKQPGEQVILPDEIIFSKGV